MDICALIMARGGSQRVPNKNIRPFGNSTLLEIKINDLKSLEIPVYVNSDSREILRIAEKAGAQCVKREPYYASDTVSINEVYKNLAESVNHQHILFAHATSPLVRKRSLRECLEKYSSLVAVPNSSYDSLATVTYIHKFLWFDGIPVNYDPQKMPGSQDLPDYYALNFAYNILPRELMIEEENIIGNNFFPYPLNDIEAYDVDTAIEFRLAESIYKEGNIVNE